MFADGEVFPDGRFTGQPAGGIHGLLCISYSGANARERLVYPIPAIGNALCSASDASEQGARALRGLARALSEQLSKCSTRLVPPVVGREPELLI